MTFARWLNSVSSIFIFIAFIRYLVVVIKAISRSGDPFLFIVIFDESPQDHTHLYLNMDKIH